MSKRELISIQSRVRATLENTWLSYTAPEHIVEWNQASKDWHCLAALSDFEVGGTFSYKMAAKDGSYQFDFEGQFIFIDYLKCIRFILSDGRKVEVLFQAEGADETMVKLTVQAEDENPIALQTSGWQGILDSFSEYTSKL